VPVDLGRLHYDRTAVFGCQGPDIAGAYRPVRTTLKPGGYEWVLGASGPMGHMHVQRALEMPPSPAKIVATNLRSPRISGLAEKFAATCYEKNIELVTLTEEAFGRDVFQARLLELTDGRGFDDVMILAPDAAAVPQAMQFAAPDSVINLFVGLPRFKTTLIDLNPLIDGQNVRLIGSSGSTIDDLQRMLDLTESGRLVTNRSVAAIAGLDGAWDGMRALEEGRFPGKVLIYPHLPNLGLTALEELPAMLPGVAALLDPGLVWNNRAEEELFRELL
jgi:threonine dehydrogenase-like Zn-dependent dehydrogenase